MAGLLHLSVGLAYKRVTPKFNVGILILLAYFLDILFGIFFVFGLEHMPEEGITTISPYSHGLLMGLIWSIIIGSVIFYLRKDRKEAILVGFLVFSHWIIDFISHPMTAVFPDDGKLPVFFDDTLTVGLGAWSTDLGVFIGEYVVSFILVIFYILYRGNKTNSLAEIKTNDISGVTS